MGIPNSLIILWDTAVLLVNDNYSTPTVNNIYYSSSSGTGSDTASCRMMCTVFPSRSSLISPVQAVSFYLVHCVGVSSVIGQNKLPCGWSE